MNFVFTREQIQYSPRYRDNQYEYRHLILAYSTAEEKDAVHKLAAMQRHLSEGEWRQLGLEMSIGRQHYGFHKPEPNVMLFKCPIID